MANTNILIKRSTTTGRPSSLLAGEFAYSYSSNTLFFGSPTGNGVVNVGGVYYTQTLDAATTANTATTLVKRDANGAFAGRLTGIADKADILTNARNFSISGTDITASTQSFDGSSAIVLNAALNAVPGLTAGSVGSTTQIPVITYGANGRILGVTTAAISTSFTIAADSGASQTISGGDTLTLVGGAGITSTASATDIVTFDVDSTVVRANTPVTLQTIDGNVTITGNLNVQGTQTTVNTQTLNIADPLIYLASNNYTSDLVDIGFAANYFDGADERHTGVFRNAGNKEYYIFDNYLPEISGNNEIDVANSSFRTANVNTGWVKATGVITSNIQSSSSQDLKIGPLGKQTTIVSSTGVIQPYTSIVGGNYSGNQIDVNSVGFGTQIKGLYEGVDIRVSSDGTGSNVSSFNTNGTLTVAGKVTAAGINLNDYTQAAFNKANAAVFNAGSNLTIGSLLIGAGGNNLTTLANTTYVLTGSLSTAKTISSLTVDAYGRVTAATGADIAIDTSQITSGILGVVRGGTGLATITTNGITYGNGTGAVGVTSAAGTSDQTFSNQILTVTNAGVPVWSSALDGGQF